MNDGSLFDGNSLLLVNGTINGISCRYALKHAVSNRLGLLDTTFVGNNGNTKDIKLAKNNDIKNMHHHNNQDATLPIVPLSNYAVNIQVQYQQGDIIDKECTCDSKYMLLTIRCVGVAL